jgi:hypothetical protein
MAITINEAIERLNDPNSVGKPKKERVVVLPSIVLDEEVTKQLNHIYRTMVGNLNQANKNIITLSKHTKQEIRKQDAELLSVSDTVNSVRIAFKGLDEKVTRIEYKVRNLSYQKPSTQSLDASKLGKTSMAMMLISALLIAALPIIKKIMDWWQGKKPDDKDAKAEKKDSAIPEQPDVKIEAQAILIEAATTIDITVNDTLSEEGKNIILTADEILLDAPEIIFSHTPIVDKDTQIKPTEGAIPETEEPVGGLAGQLGFNTIGIPSEKFDPTEQVDKVGDGGGGDFGGEGATGSWEGGGGEGGDGGGGGGGGGRRGGGGGGGGEGSPDESLTDTEPMGEGSAYLASRRAGLMKELDNNPELRNTVGRLIASENWERGGISRTAILESMVTRALYKGESLQQHIYSGFYGPINRGQLRSINKADVEANERAIANVRGGSNVTDLRTDQGMKHEHPYAREVGPEAARLKNIGGEWFSDWSKKAQNWSNRERERMKTYDEEHARKKREEITPKPEEKQPDKTSAIKPEDDDTLPVNAQLTQGTTQQGQVLSDASPDVIKPGQQYASLTTANRPADTAPTADSIVGDRDEKVGRTDTIATDPNLPTPPPEKGTLKTFPSAIESLLKGFFGRPDNQESPTNALPNQLGLKDIGNQSAISSQQLPDTSPAPTPVEPTQTASITPPTQVDTPKAPEPPAPPPPPPAPAEQNVPATTSNPEQEAQAPNSGSYGEAPASRDHNSSICII